MNAKPPPRKAEQVVQRPTYSHIDRILAVIDAIVPPEPRERER